jgi:RND family efflux transporter MFP subunit
MRTSKLLFLLVIFLLLITTNTTFAGETIIPVRIEKVCPMDLDNIIEVSAEVVPYNKVNIAAKIMGYITSIKGEEGETVASGEVVLSIDNRDIKANLEMAEETLKEAKAAKDAAIANMDFAKKQMDRMSNLVSRKATNQAVLDQAQAGFLAASGGLNQTRAKIGQAKAAIKNANVMLSYTNLITPINGVIIRKNSDVGDLTAPGQTLLSIHRLDKLYIEATVNEKDVSAIQKGKSAVIKIEALNKEFSGKIFAVIPSGNKITRTFRVKVIFDNKDLEIKPGMFAKLFITRFSMNGVLAAPKSSIINENNKNYVFTVMNQKVKKTEVKLGLEGKDYIEIKSGIPSCIEIVTFGKEFLSDGDKISILK